MTVFDFNLLRHFGHDTPRFSRKGVAKELGTERSLYEILQILSITLFKKTPILQALSASYDQSEEPEIYKQLSLFDL